MTSVICKHDAAREFLSKKMKAVEIYSKVIDFPLVPYEHEMAGKVERFNQTLQRMVTVAMHDSNMPMKYAPYCIEYCIMIYNVVPVESLNWKTRDELKTGSKPDVRYFHRFGLLARVLLPLELRKHKFHTYTEDCVYLGICPEGKGTRFLRLSNRQVCVVFIRLSGGWQA